MPSTLASSRDIRAVYAARSGVHGLGMSVHAHARADGGPGRAAVVAGRRVGGAVQRNRAKRRLRAVLRAEGLPDGFDIVVVAKSGAVVAPYPLLLREYARLRGRIVERVGVPA